MRRREPDVGDLIRVASGRVLMSADCDTLFTSEDIGCVVQLEEDCWVRVLILGKVVLFLRDHLEVVE